MTFLGLRFNGIPPGHGHQPTMANQAVLWGSSVVAFAMGITLTHFFHTSERVSIIFEAVWAGLVRLASLRQCMETQYSSMTTSLLAMTILVSLLTIIAVFYWSNSLPTTFPTRLPLFRKAPHFRLMDLPRELRDKIHEEVLGSTTELPLQGYHPQDMVGRFRATILGPVFQSPKLDFGIMLASRQLHAEFMDMLHRRASFVFNWGHGQPDSFPLSTETLSGIQNLALRLAVTPDMLGLGNWLFLATHPAAMEHHLNSPHFAAKLRERLSERLAPLQRLRKLSVHVQAIPDHLSNPVDIWLCTLRALRKSGIEPLSEVTFGLKDPTADVNKVVKVKGDQWRWTCPHDHPLIGESEVDMMNKRSFCFTIFRSCVLCAILERGDCGVSDTDSID